VIFVTCREPGVLKNMQGVNIIAGVDLEQDTAGHVVAQGLAGQKIDYLICNAGVFGESQGHGYADFFESIMGQALEATTVIGHARKAFEVNSLGTLKVISALCGNLANPSKILFVNSALGSISLNGMDSDMAGGMYGYRMSKSALSQLTKSVAIDLKNHGVTVASYCPGLVKTELSHAARNFPEDMLAVTISPEEAAVALVKVLHAVPPDLTGRFFLAPGHPYSQVGSTLAQIILW